MMTENSTETFSAVPKEKYALKDLAKKREKSIMKKTVPKEDYDFIFKKAEDYQKSWEDALNRLEKSLENNKNSIPKEKVRKVIDDYLNNPIHASNIHVVIVVKDIKKQLLGDK